MRDSAGSVDADKRWAIYMTRYPKWWRVFLLTTLVWAIGGLLGLIFIVPYFTQDATLWGLMGLGWFASSASLAIFLGSWARRFNRREHLRLLQPQGTRQSTILTNSKFNIGGTLLDPNRKRYVTRRAWSWVGNIYDEYGRTIGRGVRSNGEGGQMHSVHETDGTPILLIQPGVPDLNRRPRDTHDITDGEGHLLGTVKWREREISRQRIAMVLVDPAVQEGHENREEREVLVALTGPAGWSWSSPEFAINEDRSGRRVAEFKSYDVPPETHGESHGKTWTRIFRPSTYSLHVLDPSYDRRTLIGLAIVCFGRIEAANPNRGD